MDSVKVILRELAAGRPVGRPVQIKERGASMVPRIPEGEPVTVVPILASEVCVGDAVFVRLRQDRYVTHLVKEVSDGRYLIGNNLGRSMVGSMALPSWARWCGSGTIPTLGLPPSKSLATIERDNGRTICSSRPATRMRFVECQPRARVSRRLSRAFGER